MRTVISLLFLVPVFAACGGPHQAAIKDPPVHKIFTHGDPMQLMAGVAANDSIFDSAHLADYKGYVLANIEVIAQQSAAADKPAATTASLEKDNAAHDDRRNQPEVPYEFTSEGEMMSYGPTSGEDKLRLRFANEGGKWTLREVAGLTAQPLYYSRKTDGAAFSVLVSIKDEEDGIGLYAFYFVKLHNDAAALADLSKNFHYLIGPGIVTKWSGDISINLCGSLKTGEEEQLRDAIGSWSSSGHIGTSALQVNRSPDPIAFSDVNTNCLLMVDDFLFEDDDTSAVLGLTSSVLDLRRQQVVSSHIMMPRKAFTKIYGPAGVDPRLDRAKAAEETRSITHEFGHFLGLDHEFVMNSDGTYKFPSIMSYDPTVFKITAHDVESVANLYGPNPK